MNDSRRNFIKQSAAAVSTLLLAGYGLTGRVNASTSINSTEPRPSDMSNRVVSVHSDGATYWDDRSYPYVAFTSDAVVKEMLGSALMEMTGTSSTREAWSSIFATYRPGDKIAIKPNFNDLYAGYRGMVTTPVVLNAILDGLINILRVPSNDIIIYDCTRKIGDDLRVRISHPVNFVEPFGSNFFRKVEYHTVGNPYMQNDHENEISMTADVRDKEGNPVKCYMPMVVTASAHIINVPILKSHQYVSHSGALKNHYGTVRFSDHHTGPEYLHPPIIHQSIVDVNANPHIRHKTRLVIMDALFGRLRKRGGPPVRWNTFNDSHTNSLIVAQDPVALDTIALNLIDRELKSRNDTILEHDYLHLASDLGLGIHEDPGPDMSFKKIDYRQIEKSK